MKMHFESVWLGRGLLKFKCIKWIMEKIIIHVIMHNDTLMFNASSEKKTTTTKRDNTALKILE